MSQLPIYFNVLLKKHSLLLLLPLCKKFLVCKIKIANPADICFNELRNAFICWDPLFLSFENMAWSDAVYLDHYYYYYHHHVKKSSSTYDEPYRELCASRMMELVGWLVIRMRSIDLGNNTARNLAPGPILMRTLIMRKERERKKKRTKKYKLQFTFTLMTGRPQTQQSLLTLTRVIITYWFIVKLYDLHEI